MNEENWVEIKTTEMKKNVEKKDDKENWREGKEIAWLEMEEKREEEWKLKQQQENMRELSRNIEEIITMV